MDSTLEPEEPIINPPWGEFGRVFTLAVVSLTGKFVLNWWNTTKITNQSTLLELLQQRDKGVGLITVSNHTRKFFQSGKTLAIERGKGLNQPVMRVAAQRVAQGDWLHVFPEGRVGYAGSMEPFKWGIGKIVCDSIRSGQRVPLILPFYHSGLANVLPKGSVLPRPGNEVNINVGSLIDVSDIAPRCNCAGKELQQAWIDITSRIEKAMRQLESDSPPNRSQLPKVAVNGESLKEVAPKLPGKTE